MFGFKKKVKVAETGFVYFDELNKGVKSASNFFSTPLRYPEHCSLSTHTYLERLIENLIVRCEVETIKNGQIVQTRTQKRYRIKIEEIKEDDKND